MGLLQVNRPVAAPDQWHLATLGQFARRGLIAEQLQHLGAGADKAQPFGLTAPGELGVLGEKAVTGMNRLATLGLGNGEQLRHIQISRHAAALERDRTVGLAQMQGRGIVLGVYRHRTNTQIRTGAGDTNGDLAAVGDQ